MAGEAAEVETGTFHAKLLDEFRYVDEGSHKRVVTGIELFNSCKEERIREIKRSPEFVSSVERKKHFEGEKEHE